MTISFRAVGGTTRTREGNYIAKIGTRTFAPGKTTKTIEVKGESKKVVDETFYRLVPGSNPGGLSWELWN